MCSVSWLIDQNGYQIFFNRDEQKTRAQALPPRTQEMDGVKVLMPIDPVGQGSWISVNEHGVALCLLNNYQCDNPKAALFSRGLLLKHLSKEISVDGVCNAFQLLTLPQFAPFILLAFDLNLLDRKTRVMALEWNGSESVIHPTDSPLFSSGVDLPQVTATRKLAYQQIVGEKPTQSSLLMFHKQHHYEESHKSVCMHREDAETVSFTHIIVTPQGQEMRYVAGSPCMNLTTEALLQGTHKLPNRKSVAIPA
ncbi:hypothetical protein MUS1_14995 [Marinomonas ushuaiensis DSM 15871]|uniref:NRDE family protein n=1 Tax=Marinomonas ushuaiensis DSM 15871 TaxID=1122207 RepID=X7E395_9GAMM|nr:NRDE family protein [Marinomonas ushuaiensis]ETX10534.1 hypothetical protein MUS1_14995 [Marinomonas ushuaiensis DSM 15871]